jgi:hypothetical protein
MNPTLRLPVAPFPTVCNAAVTGPPEKRYPLANRAIGGSVCTALLSRQFVCVTFRWDQTRTRRQSRIADILFELS